MVFTPFRNLGQENYFCKDIIVNQMLIAKQTELKYIHTWWRVQWMVNKVGYKRSGSPKKENTKYNPDFLNTNLGPVYTILDSYRRAEIFLSDRGCHLHHAKAIR